MQASRFGEYFIRALYNGRLMGNPMTFRRGLLVAAVVSALTEFSPTISTVAFAQTSPANSSAAATPQGTKAELPEVDTPYGNLSFAEIQKHPKKDELLATLKPSRQAQYNEWELQAAEIELAKTTKKLEGTIREALASGIKLTPDYKDTMNVSIQPL
jgi:hypothetical protein